MVILILANIDPSSVSHPHHYRLTLISIVTIVTIVTTPLPRFDMLAQSQVMENFEKSLNLDCIDLVFRPVGHVCHLDLCHASH